MSRSLVPFALIPALVFLTITVSCNDPTEVTVIAPRDTVVHFDTIVRIVHDTVEVTVVDTLMIYCWQIDNPDHHDRTPWFECDNGTRGPR